MRKPEREKGRTESATQAPGRRKRGVLDYIERGSLKRRETKTTPNMLREKERCNTRKETRETSFRLRRKGNVWHRENGRL